MTASLPPRVLTERLILREWRTTDLDRHAETVGDNLVQAHATEGVLDRYGAWQQLCEIAGHWSLTGYGHWAVATQKDDLLIGDIGLLSGIAWPGLETEVEIGWTLRRDAWGLGYATEAANAALNWAWENLSASRIIAIIPPSNGPSARVARRLGMEKEGSACVAVRERLLDLWTIMRPPSELAPT